MISVLILTRNEEANLPASLEAVRWSDDIVVFDSYSTDRTVDIAKAAGARVIQRAFDNERDQRSASLRVAFKHPWIYNPDADEITPPDLRDEMLAATSDPDRSEVAYRVRFKNMFMGKWIKRSSLYPTWVVRLFRPERISFERSINLRYVVDGKVGRLQCHFEHHSFNQGLDPWLEKHRRYALHEAEESIKSLARGGFEWRTLFSRQPVIRRRALKELSIRLPCRPTLRFLYMYLVRMGCFDGRAGLAYCRLLSAYERMITRQVKQRQRRPLGLEIHGPRNSHPVHGARS